MVPRTLAHHNTAHENFNGPDSLKRHLALAGCLIQAQSGAELILTDGLRVINLVSEDEEGNLSKLLHAQKSIELGLSLEETLVILRVNKEYNSRDFREVVLPQTASLLMTTKIESSKFDITNRELFGGCRGEFSYIRSCGDEMRNNLLGCKVGCKIATRSFYIVMQSASPSLVHLLVLSANAQNRVAQAPITPPIKVLYPESILPFPPICRRNRLFRAIRAYGISTFNMCKSVVFPALSSPKNKSLACLLVSPKLARTSQTVQPQSTSAFCSFHWSLSSGLPLYYFIVS